MINQEDGLSTSGSILDKIQAGDHHIRIESKDSNNTYPDLKSIRENLSDPQVEITDQESKTNFVARDEIEIKMGLISTDSENLCLITEDKNELQKLVETKFHIIDSNVVDFKLAQIICFGEDHDIDSHELDIAKFIDLFYEQGDLLLIEHDQINAIEKKASQAQYVTVPCPIEGWDLLEDIINVHMTSAIEADGIFEKPSLYAKRIMAPKMRKFVEQGRENTTICRVVCTLLEVIFWGLFTKCCSCCLRCWYKKKAKYHVTQHFEHIVLPQNVEMNRRIEESLTKYKRILVIAGMGHFGLTNVKGSDKPRQAWILTRTLLRRHRYVLLCPKE